MRRYAFAIVGSAFLSLLLFPWPLTALLALLAAPLLPFVPLTLGLVADALYWAPGVFPLATLLGALTTATAFFVRSRLATGIM